MIFRRTSVALALLVVACGGNDTSRSTERDGGDGGSGGADGSGGRVTASGGRSAGGASSGGASSGGKSYGGAGTAGASGGSSGGTDPGSGGTTDGGPDASESGGAGPIADAAPDAPATCDFGTVGSFATQQQLNLFGETVYFGDGAVLPAGRYRVTFKDGCMKYAGTQDWTIHAYANGANAAWWLVGETTNDRVVVPPGTVGYTAANGGGAYLTFDECVTANTALAPVEFDFAGGKLGVWLLDSNYGDNQSGVDGRNPKWNLTLLGACHDQ